MFASHKSAEIQHIYMLKLLGLVPLLDLNMSFSFPLGEATGASIGMQLIQTASKVVNNIGTFSESGVNEAEKNLEMELERISR